MKWKMSNQRKTVGCSISPQQFRIEVGIGTIPPVALFFAIASTVLMYYIKSQERQESNPKEIHIKLLSSDNAELLH